MKKSIAKVLFTFAVFIILGVISVAIIDIFLINDVTNADWQFLIPILSLDFIAGIIMWFKLWKFHGSKWKVSVKKIILWLISIFISFISVYLWMVFTYYLSMRHY